MPAKNRGTQVVCHGEKCARASKSKSALLFLWLREILSIDLWGFLDEEGETGNIVYLMREAWGGGEKMRFEREKKIRRAGLIYNENEIRFKVWRIGKVNVVWEKWPRFGKMFKDRTIALYDFTLVCSPHQLSMLTIADRAQLFGPLHLSQKTRWPAFRGSNSFAAIFATLDPLLRNSLAG